MRSRGRGLAAGAERRWKRAGYVMVAAAAALALTAGPAIGVASPASASNATSHQIAGVSCVSASFCMAVGSSAIRTEGVDHSSRTLAERWNGTKWSIVATPNPTSGTGGALLAVSCTSASFCMAVGFMTVSGPVGSMTFAERWNGTKWSVVPRPDPASARFITLAGVSCTSPSFCIAVGRYTRPDGYQPTFVERWNGTSWSMLASPDPAVGSGSVLAAVSCPNLASCFAVGLNNIGGDSEPTTLVEHWNGTKWSIMIAPMPSGWSALTGVSCSSSTNCTAVGWSQTRPAPYQFGPPQTLVEHWNGTKWSRVTSPNAGTTNSRLSAVWCTSSTNCVAVGEGTSAPDRTSAFKTLVERWNGTKWSSVTSPNPTIATASQLAGVSCTTASSCVAVGSSTTSTFSRPLDAGPFKTLAERWNGTKWSIVTTPTPPAP